MEIAPGAQVWVLDPSQETGVSSLSFAVSGLSRVCAATTVERYQVQLLGGVGWFSTGSNWHHTSLSGADETREKEENGSIPNISSREIPEPPGRRKRRLPQ